MKLGDMLWLQVGLMPKAQPSQLKAVASEEQIRCCMSKIAEDWIHDPSRFVSVSIPALGWRAFLF